jgi:hypothetical protein
MEFVILIVLGALSWLANLGLDWVLKRRLRQFEPENVYIIPGFFRQPLLLVAVVLIPLEIVLPLAWIFRPMGGIGTNIGLLLPALMLPLLAFALVMLWIHDGAIVLEDGRIRRLYLVGGHDFPLQDLREIAQKMFFLTPVTIARGGGQQLRFPRRIQNHPELYLRLSERIQANQTDLGLAPPADGEAIRFPYTFGISAKRLLWEKIAFAILMLILAVLASLGIWIQLAQDLLQPFTWESLFIIALFFIPFGILFPILVVAIYRKTTDPETPTRFVLYRDRIEVFYPREVQECYALDDLAAVRLIPVQSTLKSEFDGAVVAEQVINYHFQLQFAGGKTFTLAPNRLAMFRQTPEALRAVFKHFYGV